MLHLRARPLERFRAARSPVLTARSLCTLQIWHRGRCGHLPRAHVRLCQLPHYGCVRSMQTASWAGLGPRLVELPAGLLVRPRRAPPPPANPAAAAHARRGGGGCLCGAAGCSCARAVGRAQAAAQVPPRQEGGRAPAGAGPGGRRWRASGGGVSTGNRRGGGRRLPAAGQDGTRPYLTRSSAPPGAAAWMAWLTGMATSLSRAPASGSVGCSQARGLRVLPSADRR